MDAELALVIVLVAVALGLGLAGKLVAKIVTDALLVREIVDVTGVVGVPNVYPLPLPLVDAVALPLAAVALPLADAVALPLADPVTVDVDEPVREALGSSVALAELDPDGVTEATAVSDGLAVDV